MPKTNRTEPFAVKAELKFPGKFSYDKTKYINSKARVTITCLKHGDFLAIPGIFLNRGTGCSACGKIQKSTKLRDSFESFLKKAEKVHPGKYVYDRDSFIKTSSSLNILCKVHGEFVQNGVDHLSGKGCSRCGNDLVRSLKTKTYASFVLESAAVHKEKYTYPANPHYVDRSSTVNILCKTHGKFKQKAFDHLAGKGCPGCKSQTTIDTHLHTFEQYVENATRRHKGRYTYLRKGYTDATLGPITIICKEHGESVLTAGNHINGANCVACSTALSAPEKELRELLKSSFTFSDRSVIKPLELDFLSLDKKIAIEFNGLYWHQESFKGKSYHLKKTELCKQLGVRLIHIREDLWANKNQQIRMLIQGLTSKIEAVYGRKTTCRPITSETSKDFLDKYHIQGSTPATNFYGLFLGNRLVSVCSFSNKRGYLFKSTPRVYELTRFCTTPLVRVVGGLSKMLAMFEKDINPEAIKSYCDLDLFTGACYEAAGFCLEKVSPPNYIYFKGTAVASRYSMQKHLLEKKLKVFDSALSEKENCENNGWFRYFGVGTATYVKYL